MENVSEEKSLVKVDNSIFGKMRRFFQGLFSKRRNAQYIDNNDVEKENKLQVEKEEVNREVYTEPKLFNYDNPQYSYDSTLGKKPILNQTANSVNDTIGQINMEDTGIEKYFVGNDSDEDNYENTEEQDDSEKYDDGYGGKDELEQKLMNYYASIKKVLQ